MKLSELLQKLNTKEELSMKNKLYNFLNKHSFYLPVTLLASWGIFIATVDTNKTVAIIAAFVMNSSVILTGFLILEASDRSHKKSLKDLENRRNSSSPEWDGIVRYTSDLIPRLQLLRERIARDVEEIKQIEENLNDN